jgi:hypothetical protein
VGQIVFFKFFLWLFSRLAARSCVIVLSAVSASDRLAVQRRTHAHQCEIPHFLSWSRFASVVAVDREFFLKENRKFARKNVHRYAKLVCWIDLKMSSENDSVSPPVNFEKCSLVLVDVAGTTTSIDFVKDTLFPFVIKQADAFLQAKWDEEAVKECLQQIKDDGADLDVAGAVERVKTLTDQQSSNKGLKTLQGLIYKDGYEKGDLKAQ